MTSATTEGWSVRFQGGTLVLAARAGAEDGRGVGPVAGFVWDERSLAWRGPACLYPLVVLEARRLGIALEDQARSYKEVAFARDVRREPRDYQTDAVVAWESAGRRGAIILPTGTGKTLVAELAIARTERSALVVVPTIDLLGQWYDRLRATFGGAVGLLGGGHHELEELTVSTYDSANLHLTRYGDRFGLVVFDEVHHLPAPAYLLAAEACIAPFRLGLTATWEREDEREQLLDTVLGPVVYRRGITELRGSYLAEYDTQRLEVILGPEERARYDEARGLFQDFVKSNRIPIGGPNGWVQFLRLAARSTAGRRAFKAYQESRRIAHGTDKKLDLLARLLWEERGRRTLIFTHDNATAYRVSREFLVPCITHHTDVKERRALLAAFQDGSLPVLATSRVLNEGVDLPAAEVAIVLSGTGTVREHVQRLGRILRPGPDKRAILYEVVAAATAEERTSDRRRKHDAYR